MVKFYYANDGVHKYIAEFDNPEQVIKFGAFGYDDFTTTGNQKRKTAYLRRHRAREDWSDPRTAGALSRWILWNKPTIEASITDFRRRFSMH
jgi:hypothetical protein